jgi:uncharacterized membrane protein YeaQ/YmgE (transglycosylase-associated protein family)
MGGLIVLLIAWLIIGGLVGAFAGKVAKSEPPFGLTVDLIASIVTEVSIGATAWFICPLLSIDGIPRLLISTIGDPLLAALIVLWILRRVKA